MNKALIEKAFKKYCLVCCSYRQTNGSDECENTNICKHAWNKGANWQREQLEAENKELKEYVNGVEFNLEKSDSINDNLQTKISELEKENDRLKNAHHEHFEQIVTDLEMKNRELEKQLHKEYAPQECLLISGRVFANILEEKQKEWEKLQELKSQLESAEQHIANLEAEEQAQERIEELEKENIDLALRPKDQEIKQLKEQLQKAKAEVVGEIKQYVTELVACSLDCPLYEIMSKLDEIEKEGKI